MSLERWRSQNPHWNLGLATGTVGAISELIVTVDMLKRGFEVFRAVSAHCSCDLAALKDGKLLRIEVKTSYRTKNTIVRENDEHKADILALVLRGCEIVYKPALESL